MNINAMQMMNVMVIVLMSCTYQEEINQSSVSKLKMI